MKKDLFAFLAAILISFVCCLILIPLLRRLKAGQPVLGYVDNHRSKSGTPTMGGISFALGGSLSFLLFCKSSDRRLALICTCISFAFLSIGAFDDYIKIKTKKNEGLTARQKIFFQTAVAVVASIFIVIKGYTDFFIPFINVYVDFGVFAAPVCFFVFLAVTNCVNLTDGLDGLAGGVCYVYFITFYLLVRVQTRVFSDNYVLPAECDNMARLCFTHAGALLGYLAFNTHKAKVFMGDTGSLYLGGLIAATGVFSGDLFFIPMAGAAFVASGVSVLLQVAHFKRTGKRVFLMAPLHHHFEYSGHGEGEICYAYKLVTLVMGVLCVLSVL